MLSMAQVTRVPVSHVSTAPIVARLRQIPANRILCPFSSSFKTFTSYQRVGKCSSTRFTASRRVNLAVSAQAVVTEAERQANHARWKESGSSKGSVDEWQWSLNWDQVVDGITVGSCPRAASDVDRIVDEGHIDAIVCLQCDDCLNALQVDLNKIRQRAAERGVAHVQVAIRDFDRQDQARMLPEAARMVGLLRRMGHRVYVHCTAGINRAPLAVVGYLTFVEGMPLYDAVNFVKSKRSRANPYVECLKDARTQLLVAETKQVLRIAEELYKVRRDNHAPEDGFADWVAAENLALKMLFERQLSAQASLMTNVQRRHDLKQDEARQNLHESTDTVNALHTKLQEQQQRMEAALAELEQAKQELEQARKARSPSVLIGSTAEPEEEKDCEIAELRHVIEEVMNASRAALGSADEV